jgi:UPF0176 protein
MMTVPQHPKPLSDSDFCVAALYQFTRFEEPDALKEPLLSLCEEMGAKGTLLIAREGINGTIAASDEGITRIVAHIRSLPGCADIDIKFSRSHDMPFGRMRVRLKREIVTLGAGEIDPLTHAGIYVEPQDWNALIADPDTIVIDTRNDYEVEIGSFEGAINPKTSKFRQFPQWFDALTADLKAQGRTPKIAMYCTGGIRCEKSTAYARMRGVEDVYHLKGGVLRYLEEVPAEESSWNGACFVFDERVSIGHGLVQGGHAMCPTCNYPYEAAAGHDCPGFQKA